MVVFEDRCNSTSLLSLLPAPPNTTVPLGLTLYKFILIIDLGTKIESVDCL